MIKNITQNLQTPDFLMSNCLQILRLLIINIICGLGGGRTLVQTRKSYAFYTLITDFIFERWQDQCHQPAPYPLKIHSGIEACRNYPRFICTTWSRRFGARALGWCLVPAPCAGIKLIYCTSIKQREQTCFRQLNCRRPIFKCPPPGALRAYIPLQPAVKSNLARIAYLGMWVQR